PVDRTGGLSILPPAIVRGAKGCRTRSPDHARAFQNARGAGERARHPPIQARRAVDDARYYTISLRHRTVGTKIEMKSEIFCEFCAFLWLRSEEHTSELQSRVDLVCRLLLEKKHHR